MLPHDDARVRNAARAADTKPETTSQATSETEGSAPQAGVVQAWFGSQFEELHPLLQTLHRHGGTLKGTVRLEMARGWRGVAARWLAHKLGLPPKPDEHVFEANISHQNGCLHWERHFAGYPPMLSVFRPVGTRSDGYWEEQTGVLRLRLQVDMPDGGWHWRCIALRFCGLALPPWLFPQSRAYKHIEDGHYRFYVGFSLPWCGTILSYSGLLALTPEPAPDRAQP